MPLTIDGTAGLSGLIITSGAGITPQGRLTLESGVPVSSTDQTGKATVLYTPYLGNLVPIYNGSQFEGKPISELSNDTTQSSTLDAGAAAAGSYQIQDCFVWNNAGTNRLTRGPKWTASATATMTIATPCVVTWTAHGLWDGATVRFTTTGALPTGLTASTDYFVTKIGANSFNLSTTLANQVAGTKIATSGTQSGVHTVFNYTSVRGTGAATTELQLLNGVYVNKYDITNGPAATKGTYVGSVYFNASSQIDLKFGTFAANGGEAIIGIWNAYNRVDVGGVLGDTTATWSAPTGAWRVANGSATIRVTMVRGLNEDAMTAAYHAVASSSNGGTSIGLGVDKWVSYTVGLPMPSAAALPGNVAWSGLPGLGLHYVTNIEYGAIGDTHQGSDGTTYQTGLSYKVRA